ncbi:helix-turn-helix domain-containing protein [Bradyrhizobium sp. CB1015]|uniref:winged helix-turn-helix transcriptional regulator n=1 Tax=Bradyrhizobium sp. CB1015 TaxID=2976822 RepID=UPI0021AA1BD6|nr:helix-turn-helix domain-containing protein [Bradyrhizobium sp. CB1015]UWU91941.1 helix-turn-helix transcriptional regulator [Bradyrhizobium sp. CB1015]
MKGKRTNLDASACAIARSLGVIGDWWSLLIIRDALAGKRRFGEFQKSLGMAKNILSVRLQKLVEHGILATAPASDGTAYKEYVLTPKGKKLYLVLAALWQWGEEFCFAPGELTYDMVDRETQKPFQPLELKARDGRVLGPGDMRTLPRRASKAQRRASSSR